MKKYASGALAGAAAAALVAALVQQPAVAAPPSGTATDQDRPQSASANRPDNRPGPLTHRQNELRKKAVSKLVKGEARMRADSEGGSTVKLSDGVFVEFPREKDDKILTILSEFGDQTVGRYGGSPGPLHNQIPEPDREQDNSTIWTLDFNKAYFEAMFNTGDESMKDYYEEASSGRYSVTNTVEDWVTVPYNGSYYGANPREDEGGAWDFINDTGDAWYAKQIADGKTPAQIDAYLADFDVWDRYDHDGDGDFNEADGYIDHFQAVHAGEGEEAGASPDTIWSHRWYVNATDFGVTGPMVGGDQNKMGGAQIGESKYFFGDYTVEPENGGLGVFAHEYAHDLGLPDFYDTAGGDNGTAFWTLMSGGSWMSHGEETGDGIGYTPNGMGPEEKLFLGWLDYSTVDPGQEGQFNLGPAAHTYTGADQAVAVNLPDKTTTTPYTTPAQGEHAWWSGRGDNLNNTLTRQVPAASRVTVTASAWHEIEAGYDYLYAEYSLDGENWTQIGRPVDGNTTRWSNLRYSYDAGGQESMFRFRYQTDGGVNEAGAFLDNIVVKAGRSVVLEDGAEAGENGWTAKGWKISTGSETNTTPQYYLLENRAYVGYDETLAQGPYNFSEGITRPNWVEYFPYQDGMLVWYVDYAYADNNTSVHAGHGMALPVDARPAPFRFGDGSKPGNRRQPLDATFSTQPTESVCLHKQVAGGTKKEPTAETLEACSPAGAGIATFDDSVEDAYWSAENPLSSTKVAGHGVVATVTGVDGNNLTVDVTNPVE